MICKDISYYKKRYNKETIYNTIKELFKEVEQKDKEYNIFISLNKENALKKAKELDLNKDKKGKLLGVPIAIKDNIAVKDLKLTCASKILNNYISPYSATVVEKLEQEDAIIVGKTNLDEFGMGSSTENSAFYPTKNPLNPEYVPGGSSGGSAAAAASDLVPVAFGSDTGGSIRQPASFTGTIGLKPTYGSVSRYGLVAFGSSLDVIGPIVKNIEDAELIYGIISGIDEKDSTSFNFVNDEIDIDNCKIGVLDNRWIESINPEILNAYNLIIKEINKNNIQTKVIKTDLWEYALYAYYIISSSEASSNLSRYDGVRYGLRTKMDELLDMYISTRTEGFGNEVKRRIFLGTYCLSAGYYDKYYKKASIFRELLKKEFENNFKKVDFILTPSTPELPFKMGEKKDPIDMYMSDWFTVSSSLAGLPAISIPFYCSKNNLTSGIQIISNMGCEKNIFNLTKKMNDIILNL